MVKTTLLPQVNIKLDINKGINKIHWPSIALGLALRLGIELRMEETVVRKRLSTFIPTLVGEKLSGSKIGGKKCRRPIWMLSNTTLAKHIQTQTEILPILYIFWQ